MDWGKKTGRKAWKHQKLVSKTVKHQITEGELTPNGLYCSISIPCILISCFGSDEKKTLLKFKLQSLSLYLHKCSHVPLLFSRGLTSTWKNRIEWNLSLFFCFEFSRQRLNETKASHFDEGMKAHSVTTDWLICQGSVLRIYRYIHYTHTFICT